MTHTKGPIRVDKHGVITGGPDFCTSIAECYSPPRVGEVLPGEVAEYVAQQNANARRIVALWNAAEELGISTEAIETGAIKDLLEACKQIVWKLSHNHDDGNGGTKPATITRNDATVRMAVAAIAKAEGKKH